MASTIMGLPAAQLIKAEHVDRVKALTPDLFRARSALEGGEQPRALSGLQE